MRCNYIQITRSPGLELFTYPLGSKQVVVQGSEPLPGIVTAISPAHEVFDDQSNVDEAYAIVRGQVSLKKTKHTHRRMNRQQPMPNIERQWVEEREKKTY